MSLFINHACLVKRLVVCRWLYSSAKNLSSKIDLSKKFLPMVTFLKEPSAEVHLKQISEEFAYPFVDINKVVEKFHSANPESLDRTESALFDHYAHGDIHKPAIDIEYIRDNVEKIEESMRLRKMESINVKDVVSAYEKLLKLDDKINEYRDIVEDFKIKQKETHFTQNIIKDIELKKHILQFLLWVRKEMEKFFLTQALCIPNKTSSMTPHDNKGGNILETVGVKRSFQQKIFNHIEIANKLGILRQSNISRMAGHRTYFLFGAGAELEHALSCFTLDKLKDRNFTFLSVPNILKDAAFDGTGLANRKHAHMVYNIENASEPDYCLSGTSEVGICAFLSSHALNIRHLPLRLCCVSSCYRRETNTGSRLDRAGLFRVHQFLKVEMFGVTANETGTESDELHAEFVEIQKEIYQELGLHYNVVDMPQSDLGLPAYRKIDIEAWFPGRNRYDEISSATNCTDYQARRLGIRYRKGKEYKFAHTVNATACAVPRIMIALLENFQTDKLTVKLPDALQGYMKGRTVLRKEHKDIMVYTGVQQTKAHQVSD